MGSPSDAEENSQGRGIETLLVEAGAGGGGGGGGGGGRACGRGCWTAEIMGGSVGNPA